MTGIVRIDPHVHFRDGAQSYKETIRHGLQLAKDQGVDAVFDMPNTSDPITEIELARARLDLGRHWEAIIGCKYFLWMGVTSDHSQLEEAVKAYDTLQRVIGLKLYAGKSTGDLAVIDEEEQKGVYKTLANLGYTGVLAVHCEKESEMLPSLWNPNIPDSHCRARPPDAEYESIKDQINFAEEASFKGTLHVCHVSTPKSVSLVRAVDKMSGFTVTCGVTPHHLLYNQDDMKHHLGNIYKCNPPLRHPELRDGLIQMVNRGLVDWIETDHAPHSIGEKLSQNPPSGYPSMYEYRHLIETYLPKIGVSQKIIDAMTYHNIKKAFDRKLEDL